MPISSNQIPRPGNQNKQHLQRFESLRRPTEDVVDHCPELMSVSKTGQRNPMEKASEERLWGEPIVLSFVYGSVDNCFACDDSV